MKQQKFAERTARVRKTPNCANPYTATTTGRGEYGFGSSPQAARDKLFELIAKHDAEAAAGRALSGSAA